MRTVSKCGYVIACGLLLAACSGADSDADKGSSEGEAVGTTIPATTKLPGRLEAENYATGGEGVGYHDTTAGNSGKAYRTDGVDIEATTDTGGGYDVGWIVAGEWLEFNVTIATAGTYSVTARMSSDATVAKQVHLELDGSALSGGSFVLPKDTGWQVWANETASVTLPAGSHKLRVAMDSSSFNINYLDFKLTKASGDTSPTNLPGWDLDWVEDFKGTTLDSSKWTPLDGEVNTDESYNLPSQVTVNSGLTIQSLKETYKDRSYVSGYIDTHGKYAVPDHFRMEVKFKVPYQLGMWGAPVWLKPETGSTDGEIDLIETYGEEAANPVFHATLHTAYSSDVMAHRNVAVSELPITDPLAWHTVVIEKTAGQIAFWYDGYALPVITPANYAPYDAYYEQGKTWKIRSCLEIGKAKAAGEPNGTTEWGALTRMELAHIYTWKSTK